MGPLIDLLTANQEVRETILLLLVFILLAWFEFDRRIPPFYARKLTHMSMGCILMCLMAPERTNKLIVIDLFIISIAVSAIILCFIKPFRFGRHADKGIIVFNALVLLFLFFQLDFGYLAPAFIADPLGAIVGTTFRSPKWIGDKTLAGSLAVFVGSLVSTFRIESISTRIVLSMACTILEATGGDLDNLVMNLPIFAYYAAAKAAA